MIFLDANVLIATFETTHPLHQAARTIIDSAAGQAMQTSAVTAAEAMVHHVRAEIKGDPIEELEIAVVDVPASSYRQLATITATSGLKMPDAIVLALATSSGATLATFDTTLAKIALAHGLTVLPTPIQ